MPSVRIANEFTSGFYYLTLTIRNWYYLFDRQNRLQILADTIRKQYVKKPEARDWSSAHPESEIIVESVVV